MGGAEDRRGQRPGFHPYLALAIFLTPLVGIIAAIVAKPDATEVERARLASGAEKKCPQCAELVKREAKVCRFCGRELPEWEPPPIREKDRKFRNHEEWLAWKAAEAAKERPTTPPAPL